MESTHTNTHGSKRIGFIREEESTKISSQTLRAVKEYSSFYILNLYIFGWLLSLKYIGGGGLVAKSCPALATPWIVAYQTALSRGFSRQEFWSGLPFPSPMTEIARSKILRNCQTVSQSGCTILHSCQLYMVVSISSYPCQYIIVFYYSNPSGHEWCHMWF